MTSLSALYTIQLVVGLLSIGVTTFCTGLELTNHPKLRRSLQGECGICLSYSFGEVLFLPSSPISDCVESTVDYESAIACMSASIKT